MIYKDYNINIKDIEKKLIDTESAYLHKIFIQC